MSEENNSKPLFYIVQPKITEPKKPEMQEIYRTKTKKNKEKDHDQAPEDSLTTETENEEERVIKEAKEAKFDQIKREFGVYDALGEIETELNSIQKIKNELHEPGGSVRVISDVNQENQENQVKEQKKDSPEVEKMRRVLTGLIRQDPKPFCEASIGGQTVRFQVIGKRNDMIKIKVGSHTQSISIHELSDLTILNSMEE
ncbi:hypothetical protein [Peribacillus huizhouensis]|uniref:Spore coat protein CotO n=1 Tax=Peribacillus huizhouensis TaxID=1501239 RepID=A0ABR6CJU6_9BACI|nr:hypothetical protein [Peribacillus huizhouensis]MBA9025164.1 hypothetical protein [Peribacillus huizhouensis]